MNCEDILENVVANLEKQAGVMDSVKTAGNYLKNKGIAAAGYAKNKAGMAGSYAKDKALAGVALARKHPGKAAAIGGALAGGAGYALSKKAERKNTPASGAAITATGAVTGAAAGNLVNVRRNAKDAKDAVKSLRKYRDIHGYPAATRWRASVARDARHGAKVARNRAALLGAAALGLGATIPALQKKAERKNTPASYAAGGATGAAVGAAAGNLVNARRNAKDAKDFLNNLKRDRKLIRQFPTARNNMVGAIRQSSHGAKVARNRAALLGAAALGLGAAVPALQKKAEEKRKNTGGSIAAGILAGAAGAGAGHNLHDAVSRYRSGKKLVDHVKQHRRVYDSVGRKGMASEARNFMHGSKVARNRAALLGGAALGLGTAAHFLKKEAGVADIAKRLSAGKAQAHLLAGVAAAKSKQAIRNNPKKSLAAAAVPVAAGAAYGAHRALKKEASLQDLVDLHFGR